MVMGHDARRDTENATTFMHDLASVPLDAPPPDPSFLWWKAQMLRRWDTERQAAAPIDLGERVQIGVGFGGVAALLAWMWTTAPFALSAAMLAVITITIVLVAGAAAWSLGPRE